MIFANLDDIHTDRIDRYLVRVCVAIVIVLMIVGVDLVISQFQSHVTDI